MNATVWSPAVPGKRSTVKPGFPLSANFVRAKNRKIMLRGEGGGGGGGGEWNWKQDITQKTGAGIFKESMGARNRVGIELSYRPARLHRRAEFIPWNRFLGSINV
jgi:hypothetical protein